MADDPPGSSGLGPLRNLPAGVIFDRGTDTGVAFDRLGRACKYNAAQCPITAPIPTGTLCPGADLRFCNDRGPGAYMAAQANGSWLITVRDTNTQLTRWVAIAPGGRVSTQR
jgi:hypothetical protein